MKSAVSVLLCLCIIFSLSACTAGKKQFVLEESCNTVSFDMTGITVKGRLDYKSKDDIAFTLTEPQNLSGITFTENEIKTDDVKIGYSGPIEESPVYMLISIIADMAQKEIYLPYKGSFTFDGGVSSAEYKINFDCENAEIISIETGKYTYIFE